ncbi:uncharacterized protein [Argopecten irradians]|uniref:uncharacterized protein n=1 Tax=Argopecten irradians TaxID=31199 RepID=UPI003722380D
MVWLRYNVCVSSHKGIMNFQFILKLIFEMGLKQNEIVALFDGMGFSISERHLRRFLSELNLKRRGPYSSSVVVTDFIRSELQSSGKLHGYRWMHQKLLNNGLKVRKEDVRKVLQIMDPAGCVFRRRRRLYRRTYFAAGPHFTWHIDGYDKIKQFGFAISGCIDGFSRKLILLNVYHTNNDPRVIGGYFVEAMEEYCGMSQLVRTDAGTENVRVREILESVQATHGEKSEFITGSSHSNQRIECFWGHLRKQCMEYWICLFHKLQDTGSYNGDFLDKNLMQFCFMAIIQDELDATFQTWNSHQIRTSGRGLPAGRPNVMMNAPYLYSCRSFLKNVEQRQIQMCRNLCEFRKKYTM